MWLTLLAGFVGRGERISVIVSADDVCSYGTLRQMRVMTRRAFRSLRYRSDRALASLIVGPYTTILRRRARRLPLLQGVTVVSVNYNTLPFMKVLVFAVRRFSGPDTRILIVDNASTDGSQAWIAEQRDIDLVALSHNVNHGPALDIGVLRCRTERFVALDIDAFPISGEWLARLLTPLDDGVAVSGASTNVVETENFQPYVHACCLAMSTARFRDREHTFKPSAIADTAQSISQGEWPNVHLIPVTSIRGPGMVGTVFGDVVYHNFYSARFAASDREQIDWVRRGDPETAWREAVQHYFPAIDFEAVDEQAG